MEVLKNIPLINDLVNTYNVSKEYIYTLFDKKMLNLYIKNHNYEFLKINDDLVCDYIKFLDLVDANDDDYRKIIKHITIDNLKDIHQLFTNENIKNNILMKLSFNILEKYNDFENVVDEWMVINFKNAMRNNREILRDYIIISNFHQYYKINNKLYCSDIIYDGTSKEVSRVGSIIDLKYCVVCNMVEIVKYIITNIMYIGVLADDVMYPNNNNYDSIECIIKHYMSNNKIIELRYETLDRLISYKHYDIIKIIKDDNHKYFFAIRKFEDEIHDKYFPFFKYFIDNNMYSNDNIRNILPTIIMSGRVDILEYLCENMRESNNVYDDIYDYMLYFTLGINYYSIFTNKKIYSHTAILAGNINNQLETLKYLCNNGTISNEATKMLNSLFTGIYPKWDCYNFLVDSNIISLTTTKYLIWKVLRYKIVSDVYFFFNDIVLYLMSWFG